MSLLDELKKQTKTATEATSNFKKNSGGAVNDDIIQAVSIPIEIERDGGKLRVYIQVPAEAVSSTDTLNAVLDKIEEKFDLAIWRSRNTQAGGGFKSSYKKRW